MTAGNGIGAGLTALVLLGRGRRARGSCWVFALALVPLAATPLLARRLEEPDRYQRLRAAENPELAPTDSAVLGRVRTDLRPRLWLLAVLAFSIAFVTGPMNTFLFVVPERARDVPLDCRHGPGRRAHRPGRLLMGRWAADGLGRRVTAASAQAMVALAGMLTYSGSRAAVAAGYLAAILVARPTRLPSAPSAPSCSRPARGPPSLVAVAAGVLGAVAGLVAFGLLTDALNSFGDGRRC